MFSLIITILSIAMVVAMVALGGYYGGSSVLAAQNQATAVRLKSEESQIMGAVDIFQADKGRYPNDLQELYSAGYLNSIPSGWVAQLWPARGFEFISAAYAQDNSGGWSTPVQGQPIFTTTANIPLEVCSHYNFISRGDDGILKQPFESQAAQCYGSENAYRILVRKAGAIAWMPSAVTPDEVQVGGLPEKNTKDLWWDKKPSGDIKADIDPSKSLFAELTLLPGTDESFGDLQIGQETISAARSIRNKGNIPAQSVAVTVPEGFQVVNSSCGSSLEPGESCSFAVKFTPTQAKGYSGPVNVGLSNGSSQSFVAYGRGQAASGQLSIASFGELAAGSALTRDATLINTGIGPLTLSSAQVSGAGFELVGDSCAGALPAGASCTVQVRLTATALDSHTGAVSVPTVEAGSISASMMGQSQQAILAVAASSRDFGGVQVGQSSTSAAHVVTNAGNIAVTSLVITPPSGYSLSASDCTSSLEANASCSFAITFSPLEAKPYNAAVSLASANTQAAAVNLTGFGFLPTASISAVAFGPHLAGSQVDRAATLTNTGAGPLSVTPPAASSVTGAGFSFVGTTCGASLASGGSCTITVRYTVSGAAVASGSLNVQTDAGTKTAVLSGQSLSSTLSMTYKGAVFGGGGISFSTPVGTTFNTSFYEINNGTLTAIPLSYSVPAAFSIVDSTCPATLASGATCQLRLQFKPTARRVYTGNLQVSGAGYSVSGGSLTGTGT